MDTSVEVDGRKIPVRVHVEWRKAMRASIGKRRVNLRIPRGILKTNIDDGLKWVQKWLTDLNEGESGFLNRIAIKEYHSGQLLLVGPRTYTLHISYENRKSHTAKLVLKDIYLRLAVGSSDEQLQKAIKTLLSRVVAKDFFVEIQNRVFYWNDRYFNQNVRGVKLKYTTSNWGSCSLKGNINLSTRLLFAPQRVIDYVIVHELAHLLEHNHSSAFWKIVRDVIPDYKEKEAWLKENKYLCDF